MLKVVVERDRVRIGERFAVTFQRTLRLPDDGRTYPLPPGLGAFPLKHVVDCADRVPESWRAEGGVFLPMYQREALWLGFEAADWKPNAVKVGVGRVNALTGAAWDETLRADPQDYLVCPPQPWLDGIKTGEGQIRQFLAMPLGAGFTIEAQVSGQELFGGIQVAVFEPKPGRFPDWPTPRASQSRAIPAAIPVVSPGMGIAAGGMMCQKVYPDPHGIDTWDPNNCGVCVIHIVNSEDYRAITGSDPPPSPIDARTYTRHGFPWFDLYDEGRGDLRASEELTRVKSVLTIEEQRGGEAGPGSGTVDVPESQIRRLGYPEV